MFPPGGRKGAVPEDFVRYASVSSADCAIREFEGAIAAGQPIRLTLLPAPSADLTRGGYGRYLTTCL